jgi:hypothetical protein
MSFDSDSMVCGAPCVPARYTLHAPKRIPCGTVSQPEHCPVRRHDTCADLNMLVSSAISPNTVVCGGCGTPAIG